jgi:hypothetical protein
VFFLTGIEFANLNLEEIMTLRTLFTINAIVAVLFGLAFLLAPVPLLASYGVELSDAGLYVARLLGSAFIAFALISWFFRDSPGSSELRAVILALFVSDLIGFVLSLIYQLQGVANALGWSTVVIYLLLGVGFGYFYMSK